jgi:hypothetical protein
VSGASSKNQDDYITLVDALEDELSANSTEDELRTVVRQEVDSRMIIILTLCFALWQVNRLGWPAQTLGIVVFAGWIAIKLLRRKGDPSKGRNLIVGQAQDIIRLELVAEDYVGGICPWIYDDGHGEDSDGTPTIHAKGSITWENFWERTYHKILDLKKVSPKNRHAQFMTAIKNAESALLLANNMAKEHDCVAVFWAQNALDKIEGKQIG